jgi:hypothetical protein
MIFMLAPAPTMTFASLPSGSTYVSDQDGLVRIANDSIADQLALQLAGCVTLNPVVANGFIGKLPAANFNVTTDQQIPITGTGNARIRVTRITAENTSVNGMSTAAGGIYTAASKGGTAIVASGQVYTGLSNADTALDLTLAVPWNILEPAIAISLTLSLTTPQGAPATADIYIFGDVYS